MAGTPGITAFSLPGSAGPLGRIGHPMGNFNFPAGYASTFGPRPMPSTAARTRNKPASTRSDVPLDVTEPLIGEYGIRSPFNPMMALDLMSMGLGQFQSPFAGSGLPGYPPASYGARGSAAAALGKGFPAGPSPVPSSGGKGMPQGY